MGIRSITMIVACCATVAGCAARPDPGPAAVQITGISFTAIPHSGPPNATLAVCWQVNGTGTIPETAIRTDTTRPNTPEHPDYAGPAYYPANASHPANVALPNTFCTGVKLPAAGVVYVEAFAKSTLTNTTVESAREAISVEA